MATHSSILAWRISMDRGAWWVTVPGVAKSGTCQRQLPPPCIRTAVLQEPVRRAAGPPAWVLGDTSGS